MRFNPSRRDFMKQLSAMSVLSASSPLLLNLARLSHAAEPAGNYRALVCFFMAGGNDHFNMVVPSDNASYSDYQTARPTLALDQATLLPLTTTQTDLGGRRFGLHPAMTALQALFNNGKAAILANVGTLTQPIPTAADYKANRYPTPPKLFSHNDQQSIWQTFAPEGASTGWGGHSLDALLNLNTSAIFSAVSPAGNTPFLSGQQTRLYQVSTTGAVDIYGAKNDWLFGTSQAGPALRNILKTAGDNWLEQDLTTITQRSIEAEAALTAALAQLPKEDGRVILPTELASNRTAQQLQIIARMIGTASLLGMQRQVFFVNMGGFDTHDNQLSAHSNLLATVSGSIAYFQQCMENLGLANNVTLFTASDFGRTLASNGDGSDHGWGAYHFIVGGAVNGGQFYGSIPPASLGHELDVGSGRWLPTTAVDQYAATLARWFGVADSDLDSFIPNLKNFSQRNLGFV